MMKDITVKEPDVTYNNIRNSIINAQNKIVKAVNSAIVESYWRIGEQIYKECGENERAEYGKYVLQYLSERLTKEFGKGFSLTNLKYMRAFYLAFPKGHTVCDQSLSWSHYRAIMRVENPTARQFYVEECLKSGWSVRQLERQIHTLFYERLLASRGDESVKNEIYTSVPKEAVQPTEILKSTYILEFLGLEDNSKYHEKELEQAIIDHLQKFLLELGRGFSFVARQKRLAIGSKNFYIDLVFYNYILKCYVLIDLKVGEITHQDIGQMQMYTNYYKRELMNEGDNQPIGIVLGAENDQMVVKYTLPENNTQIFTAKYKTYLPTEEELRRELSLENFKPVSRRANND
ncbi:MAG: PDDEXK nuclease domain-containing protein [Alphaproteobacteria bacterium]|nr:PDDEXK nuclease domain-containing protein [Alphaproteobacteria bacterium]